MFCAGARDASTRRKRSRARSAWISHFHANVRVLEEQYGDAILTTLPSALKRSGRLPGRPGLRTIEPRGALWATIDVGGAHLHVVNTHLSLIARERRTQTDYLLGEDWMGGDDCTGPVALVGDFNLVPRSRLYHRLAKRMLDAQRAPGMGARARPFRLPFRCCASTMCSRGATFPCGGWR